MHKQNRSHSEHWQMTVMVSSQTGRSYLQRESSIWNIRLQSTCRTLFPLYSLLICILSLQQTQTPAPGPDRRCIPSCPNNFDALHLLSLSLSSRMEPIGPSLMVMLPQVTNLRMPFASTDFFSSERLADPIEGVDDPKALKTPFSGMNFAVSDLRHDFPFQVNPYSWCPTTSLLIPTFM